MEMKSRAGPAGAGLAPFYPARNPSNDAKHGRALYDTVFEVHSTPETNRTATIESRPQQQELGGEIHRTRSAVGVPTGTLCLKECPAAEDAKSGVAVSPLALGPLPNVAAHIIAAERGPSQRKCLDWSCSSSLTIVATVGFHDVTPRIFSAIKSLGGVLPFLLGGQSFAGPGGVSAGVVQTNIDHGMLFLACGNSPVLPVFQETFPVSGLVAAELQESGEVQVGYQTLVHGEWFKDCRLVEMAQAEAIRISQVVPGRRDGIIKPTLAHAHIHVQHGCGRRNRRHSRLDFPKPCSRNR